MPARVSTARAKLVKIVANDASHEARASGTTAPHVDAPEETTDSELRTRISTVFFDAQRNIAGHRKLVVTLRKLQEACSPDTSHQHKKKNRVEGFEEDKFIDQFLRCSLHVLPVRKSENVGDRLIQFIGLFIKLAYEKEEIPEQSNKKERDIISKYDTPTTRLTYQLAKFIIPYLTAKDKTVRYRSTQLISQIINSLDFIGEELYQLFRQDLTKRIHDKEATIRVQAVLGLSRLASNNIYKEPGDSVLDTDEAELLSKLLSVLQNDPAAEVRKTLLIELPILPSTLPNLLERARDQDPAIRRALYSKLLPTLGDFRHLSLSMREKLLRWGLRDRDDNVVKATHKIFCERWIEDCAASAESEAADDGGGRNVARNGILRPPNLDALLELLERIDVVNSGISGGIALEAMRGFWDSRADYRDQICFEGDFWDTLTAESVFMARTYNDFCRTSQSDKYESIIEEKMPEVTRLAFYLERYTHVLMETLARISRQEQREDPDEEDTVEQEFIVEQLLHIVRTLDYSDEIGRRKMFSLLRQSLSKSDLPEEITKLTVEALRHICAADASGEREFCSVVLEAVADVHDTIVDDLITEGDNEESFHSAKSELSSANTRESKEKSEEEKQKQAIREILVNIKCLHIVQCMLENVAGNLQQNSDLIAMLNNLVVPAVRSHEAPVRERGLLCLGLCSLLDKSLAEENLTLFIHFFSKGHPALQITALQIITDVLATHGAHFLEQNPLLLKVYLKALKSGNKTPEVQAVATVAVAKLLLDRVISNTSSAVEEFLRVLVVMYFDPSTASNVSMRQTLAYFLSVYSYSSQENQGRMRKVAVDTFHKLFEINETEDDEYEAEGEMISLTVIGAHLVDWTDPRKCYVPQDHMTRLEETPKKNVNGDVHLELAQDIIESFNSSISREEKKILASLLTKIHVSPASTPSLLCEVYNLVTETIDRKIITDTTGRNALFKIHVSLGKIVNSFKEIRGSEDPVHHTLGTSRDNTPLSVDVEKQTGACVSTQISDSVDEESQLENEREDTALGSASFEAMLSEGEGEGDTVASVK
ncbi:unnamed protein product [Blumeria hordei]|uniref:Nuclear condensin complex subunit 3 C-terminal domain-containing protein n=1 Tax=Blumeria hordei TaxID=2867405 RepID=A0A383UJ82_BLUHO|nr:unnamed protein product [Blumeria hordei]